MFNEKDILARLQKGESMDTIAEEMTKVMNSAKATYDAQKESEEKARKAKDAQVQEQRSDMKYILSLVEDYVRKYVPKISLSGSLVTSENIQRGIEIMDEVAEMLNAVNDLGKFLSKGDFVSPVKKKSSDRILDEFLKNMGW